MTSIEHFVIAAGQKHGDGSEVYLITARTPAQAHEMATVDFRRKRSLPSSEHVTTRTLYRSEREAESTLFLARLTAEMALHEPPGNARSSTDG